MRKILLSFCLACIASTAHATTIDFEEYTNQPGGTGSLISQGFELTSNDGVTAGSWSISTIFGGTLKYSWCATCTLTLENANEELFSISSANVYVPVDDFIYPTISITGYLFGGGTVQTYSQPAGSQTTFGSEWTNLQRIEFSGYGAGWPPFQAIDNIVVSTVPVPPAIWLFASALLGLMRLRKLQRPAQ